MALVCNSCSAVAQWEGSCGWDLQQLFCCGSSTTYCCLEGSCGCGLQQLFCCDQVQLIAVGRAAVAVPLVHDAA